MQWNPDTKSKTPIYRQLADYIKDLIKHGHLNPGASISVRDISDKYGLSRGTVVNAFDELKSAALITTKNRSATHVAADACRLLAASQEPDWHGIINTGSQVASNKDLFETSFRATDVKGCRLAWTGYCQDIFEQFTPLMHSMQNIGGDLSILENLN